MSADLATQIRPLARTWVAQTFFGPLLKEARNSPLAQGESPLSGGRGGSAFASLLDQHLAERAGRGAGEKLVDALVNQIARR